LPLGGGHVVSDPFRDGLLRRDSHHASCTCGGPCSGQIVGHTENGRLARRSTFNPVQSHTREVRAGTSDW
jgi:hypothetical protein